MNISPIILVAGIFILFVGCATAPENASDVAVRVGMSRTELQVMYGQPLRVEPNDSGGQDWYYHFYSWGAGGQTVTVSGETTDPAGNTTDSSSESLQVGKGIEEEPIHLSPEGYVVAPLPSGKVIKN